MWAPKSRHVVLGVGVGGSFAAGGSVVGGARVSDVVLEDPEEEPGGFSDASLRNGFATR